MNKLYWIVCEENDRTLYEGRFLGRTRGAALKHLKEQLGRSSLTGLVFSITEIPVPLIREIVQEVMAGNTSDTPMSETRPPAPVEPEADNVVRYAAFGQESDQEPEPAPQSDVEDDAPPPSGATTRNRTDYDWEAIKTCYMEGRGPKDVAAMMDVPINTLRKRITREGWAKQRRQA